MPACDPDELATMAGHIAPDTIPRRGDNLTDGTLNDRYSPSPDLLYTLRSSFNRF